MIMKKVNDYKTKLELVHRRLEGSFYKTIGDSILPNSIEDGLSIIKYAQNIISIDSTISTTEKNKKERKLRNLERQLKNEFGLIATYLKGKNKYTVEAHKKFSIPFACILFVLLGAPLGVMAKRGGFAVSTSLSFGFFLVYYVLLIGGEELADRNQVSPEVGMWAPNFVLFIIASYLTFHTIRERAPISILFSLISKKSKS
jgi:lipopolysaccharide export LptBFGC system permease protein LptF